MLQNTSYMIFLKTKQNDCGKKSHQAGVEPETFDVYGQRIIHCSKQPLLRPFVKLIVFNIFVPTR